MFFWTNRKEKKDIMSSFMMESEKDQAKMSDYIILNFIIGGKDISANTLTWFFYAKTV